MAAALLLLHVLLLLPVVDLQQVQLHAVGDLRAQVPDEHTAVSRHCDQVTTVIGELHASDNFCKQSREASLLF